MTRRIPALAVVITLLALALLAGCGSSYSASSGSTATSAPPARATTVATASSDLGTVLVGPGGRTIYLFERDRGPRSTCSGTCLEDWPAVTTRGTPRAGTGTTAAMLATTRRGDGTTQVTYAGHPLYYYAGDSSAGDANGQGLEAFGAKWYVVAPDGTAVVRQASGGSGGGYGY